MRTLTPRNHPTSTLAALLVVLVLFAAACGSDDDTTADAGDDSPLSSQHDDDDGDEHDDDGDEHDEFSFGEPADAADADRVIEIDANDDFTFDPDDVEIEVGEIVTFRVTNTGNLPHDFTLGDADLQDDHEAEMADMPMGDSHGDSNAMVVAAGEMEEMTWHFTEPGEILMGCHVPGHYNAGMRGTIRIMAAA